MNHSDQIITSTANPKFRFLLSLERPRVRKETGLTAVEGSREISVALESGTDIISLYCTEMSAKSTLIARIRKLFPGAEHILLSRELYAKAAYRESEEGMIAVVKPAKWSLESYNIPGNALVMVLSGVEKPGNIGAMLRTADAAGIDAVFCCDMPGDLFNPNTIRASLGTIFALPVIEVENGVLLTWLKTNNVKIFCSHLFEAERYDKQDYTGTAAIVMGSEAKGVSSFWEKYADVRIGIPMLGRIDSMNVSVAAAIIISEAKRQRGWV